MSNKVITAKVVKGHVLTCYAIKNAMDGTWDTPWSSITEQTEYRDSIGRKNRGGYHRWKFARCNCTHCDALVMFREQDILTMLPDGKP